MNQRALPQRSVVRSYLADLASGKSSRQEVADWAVQFILGDYDHLPVTDEVAWEMLSTLAGADIKDSPTSYLYDQEDFADWMEQLKNE